jgi:hypothetical protein
MSEREALMKDGRRHKRSTLVMLAATTAAAAIAGMLAGRSQRPSVLANVNGGAEQLAVVVDDRGGAMGKLPEDIVNVLGERELKATQRWEHRAQLIAMAERAVNQLVQKITKENGKRMQWKRVGRSKNGLRVANTPQLASVSNHLMVGGHSYVRSQMLSAIDAFFESDQNKLLVAQAIEEEALEAENGGQGEGTDVMAADALERLEGGDTEFENEWANAGERTVATAAGERATHATYKFMIERDLGHAHDEFTAAKAEADAEEQKLQEARAGKDRAQKAAEAAQQAIQDAGMQVQNAEEVVAAAEARQAALDAQAESDAVLAASCPELAEALQNAGAADAEFEDAIELVVDASGDHARLAHNGEDSTTVQDVGMIGDAAEMVSGKQGAVSSARSSCLASMGMDGQAGDSPTVPNAMTLEAANAAKEAAWQAQAAAEQAFTEKEAELQAAAEAEEAQQAIYDAKKATQGIKQGIMDKLLEAHKALACNPNKLASVEPYTIEKVEVNACEFPADASRVQFAITQVHIFLPRRSVSGVIVQH